jgi:hypothetical protein
MTGPHLRAYERHPLALPVRCLGALDEGVVEVHGTTADVSAGGCRVVLEREREGLARLHPIVIAMVEVGDDDVVMLGQLVRDDQAAHARRPSHRLPRPGRRLGAVGGAARAPVSPLGTVRRRNPT